MRKIILFFILVISSVAAFSQKALTPYAYCELVGTSNAIDKKIAMSIDFGQKQPLSETKDSITKGIKSFSSMVEALNYVATFGWEFVSAYTTGGANTPSVYHWLLKKPITDSDLIAKGRLLFYAPLITDKNAAYEWDNQDMKPIKDGGMIQKGEWLCPSSSVKNSIAWKSKAPNVPLTLSAYITRTSDVYGHDFSIGVVNNPEVMYAGGTFGIANDHTQSEVLTSWITWPSFNFIPEMGEKYFVSLSLIPNGTTLTAKLYINGKFDSEFTWTDSRWLGFNNGNFSIGTHNSNDNMIGNVSQFSVHALLQEAEILKLYNNNGIPKIN